MAAVHNGLIGLDEACEIYRMSVEEFRNWEQSIGIGRYVSHDDGT